MAHILTKIKFLHMIVFNFIRFVRNKTSLSLLVQRRETSSKNVKKRNINAEVAKKNFSKITSAIRGLFIRWTEFECLMYHNEAISLRVRWITSLQRCGAVVRTLRVQKCMHTFRMRVATRRDLTSPRVIRLGSGEIWLSFNFGSHGRGAGENADIGTN